MKTKEHIESNGCEKYCCWRYTLYKINFWTILKKLLQKNDFRRFPLFEIFAHMWQTKFGGHIVGEENVKQIEVWEFDKCDSTTRSPWNLLFSQSSVGGYWSSPDWGQGGECVCDWYHAPVRCVLVYYVYTCACVYLCAMFIRVPNVWIMVYPFNHWILYVRRATRTILSIFNP